MRYLFCFYFCKCSVGPNSAYGDEEDLFSPYPIFSKDVQLKEYCLCAAEADHKDDITTLTDIHCNLSQPLVQCESAKSHLANKLYQECHINRMRRDTSNIENFRRKIVKRNALDSDDLIDEIPLTYHANYDPNYLPSVSFCLINTTWINFIILFVRKS